jgi:predicted Zn-dependent protease
MLRAMFRQVHALSLALLLALPVSWLGGCTTNPVSGREEIVFMSAETEQELGDEAARQVEAQLGIIADTELDEYIQQIGAELAKYSPRQDVEYSFHVVEMEEPNAFALPGGYIYVSRGLLA